VSQRRQGLLSDIVLVALIIMGLTNFFAQFVFEGFKPDPLITVAFLGIAGTLVGVKYGGPIQLNKGKEKEKEEDRQ
jgi:uncharacterized membrane protein